MTSAPVFYSTTPVEEDVISMYVPYLNRGMGTERSIWSYGQDANGKSIEDTFEANITPYSPTNLISTDELYRIFQQIDSSQRTLLRYWIVWLYHVAKSEYDPVLVEFGERLLSSNYTVRRAFLSLKILWNRTISLEGTSASLQLSISDIGTFFAWFRMMPYEAVYFTAPSIMDSATALLFWFGSYYEMQEQRLIANEHEIQLEKEKLELERVRIGTEKARLETQYELINTVREQINPEELLRQQQELEQARQSLSQVQQAVNQLQSSVETSQREVVSSESSLQRSLQRLSPQLVSCIERNCSSFVERSVPTPSRPIRPTQPEQRLTRDLTRAANDLSQLAGDLSRSRISTAGSVSISPSEGPLSIPSSSRSIPRPRLPIVRSSFTE